MELMRHKEEEAAALAMAHEADTKKAALALEAAKNKASHDLRVTTTRLEALLERRRELTRKRCHTYWLSTRKHCKHLMSR